MRRSRHDHPRVFNSEGQRVLETIYAARSRKRASFDDVAESVARFLSATGEIERYQEPGIDPLEAIEAAREHGIES